MNSENMQARFKLAYPAFTLDVDLDLPGRGVTALFGHSGSGKTTLLRLIAGLAHTHEGYFAMKGEVWQDGRFCLPTHRRALGYVFQEASLFPHLSARGNLEYGMKRSAERLDRAALDHVIELLGIGHLLERKPGQLSGGERQRVAIARALAIKPRLLLMDEPLSALDLKRKQEILPYLERLHDELEIPVLYVTHSPDEVARLADHLVLLEGGKALAAGTINEVMTRLDLPLARDEVAESIIETVVAGHDDKYNLTYLDCRGGRFAVGRLQRTTGKPARVRIHARDVSIALKEHRDSSIANILQARVQEIVPLNDWQMIVRLGLGPEAAIPLLARITRRSADLLELTPGKQVYAQVKSVVLAE
ncbi:molybdenum ABC transporter ATP-binding protein [Sulfurivermis fontis]|uniref:molybdenum ABC transporter ATP-binding protein n=1 Tax=Sulfurivermis fontis TaxID=1972068 RepID=UPI000FD885D5|nr:molybdenum ABC transporter ATP-binding protein [Sulfurivermis fontis]